MQRSVPRRGLQVVRRLALVILAISLAACSRGLRNQSADDGPVTIAVDNRNYLDVTVYALIGSSRVRIGQVTGSTTASFDVMLRRISVSGDVRFLVDPIGSNRVWASDMIHVYAGQVVELIVESDVSRSTYSIRGE